VSLLFLSLFAFLAGFVDAVVGGGGLIQIPALLLFLPDHLSSDLAAVLGTNKLASIFGTATAVRQYATRVGVRWQSILPSAVAAFASAFVGAMTVAHLDRRFLEPLILVMLVLVTAYTALRPDLGRLHAPTFTAHRERSVGIVVGLVLGFYDGFFGPGMGSFLVFTFVGLFGFDFLSASASAKVINFATNLAALAFFVPAGHVLYGYGLPMAACQVAGSFVGTHVALRRGNAFVRVLFLGVAAVLIGRFGWDVLR
jgi:uncharacterized membrane protein YfcA